MILFDVNVFVNAHRPEQEHHEVARDLVLGCVTSPAAFALSEPALAGFVRVATDPRVFRVPSPLERALAFVNALLDRPNARVVRPGPRHWELFEAQCRLVQARGRLVADAAHAALAIEHGCEWWSFDRDFAQFPDLRWRHPLDP